jgi:hypothetical protein
MQQIGGPGIIRSIARLEIARLPFCPSLGPRPGTDVIRPRFALPLEFMASRWHGGPTELAYKQRTGRDTWLALHW